MNSSAPRAATTTACLALVLALSLGVPTAAAARALNDLACDPLCADLPGCLISSCPEGHVCGTAGACVTPPPLMLPRAREALAADANRLEGVGWV